MNSYRISRQQRVILEVLYECQQRDGKRVDYWDLLDAGREKIGLQRATKSFVSSFGRSVRNLLEKAWICAYSHSFGQGRGHYVRMFDVRITSYGIFALKNRAVR